MTDWTKQTDSDNAMRALGQLIRIIRDYLCNRVLGAPSAVAPTTASTQATGAAGATEVRVNLPEIRCIVNETEKTFTAEADRVLHDTTVYTGVDATTLTSGKSAIITIVAKNNAGTVTLVDVKGGTATTGAQVEPTDAQIAAVVTGGLPYIKVSKVTINRTGDETITQSQDNSCQPRLGVNIDQGFFDGFTE